MDLFVYGTLQCAALMDAVAGPGQQAAIDATLPDYCVKPVADHVVPLIAEKPDAVAVGLLWSGLSEQQVARLDAYECAFSYTLIDVVVSTATGERAARMYLPPGDIRAGHGTWSLADWEAGHLRPACLTAKELFATDEIPTPAQIRGNWPLVEKRAWARHRAAGEDYPATLRYAPQAGDLEVEEMRPPVGAFYRMQDFDVSHRRFDGTLQGPLKREAFIGIDAVMVLPYDPKRDRVLLIEQVRMGSLMRHDRNPWSLEPIAGMIDARETPEGSAHREAMEEAELAFRALEHISSHYPSPGSATDFFYCYVGICDLPADTAYQGGLASEAEDLRAHTVSFDHAIALVKSGEINAGPLVMMLFWLALERDRLRAAA